MTVFNSILEANTEMLSAAILPALLAALALGLIISMTYVFTHKKEGCLNGFAVTLVIFPVMLSAILSLAGDSGGIVMAACIIAAAVGFFNFRGVVDASHTMNFAYIFFSLSAGFACGRGYISYAAIITVIICIIWAALYLLKYPFISDTNMQLRITIPENVDYEGLFDDLLATYTNSYTFRRLRTIEFGSLFEISYEINLKSDVNRKEFLDKIRCRNNNLSVSISIKEIFDPHSY